MTKTSRISIAPTVESCAVVEEWMTARGLDYVFEPVRIVAPLLTNPPELVTHILGLRPIRFIKPMDDLRYLGELSRLINKGFNHYHSTVVFHRRYSFGKRFEIEYRKFDEPNGWYSGTYGTLLPGVRDQFNAYLKCLFTTGDFQ